MQHVRSHRALLANSPKERNHSEALAHGTHIVMRVQLQLWTMQKQVLVVAVFFIFFLQPFCCCCLKRLLFTLCLVKDQQRLWLGVLFNTKRVCERERASARAPDQTSCTRWVLVQTPTRPVVVVVFFLFKLLFFLSFFFALLFFCTAKRGSQQEVQFQLSSILHVISSGPKSLLDFQTCAELYEVYTFFCWSREFFNKLQNASRGATWFFAQCTVLYNNELFSQCKKSAAKLNRATFKK